MQRAEQIGLDGDRLARSGAEKLREQGERQQQRLVLLALVTDDHLITDSMEPPALKALRNVIHQWHRVGTPHTEKFPARLLSEGDTWQVRLARIGY